MKQRNSFGILFIAMALFFTTGYSCKKETPHQGKEEVRLDNFQVFGGTFEKGGLGYILTADKDKTAVAFKKTATSFNNTVVIKCQIKAAAPSGNRNGFIVFGENPQNLGKVLLSIGGQGLAIQGPFVKKVEMPVQIDQSKIFNTEIVIDLAGKTVTWKVDGAELKTQIIAPPASLNYVGYAVWQSRTEFSDLQISGK